MHDLGCRSQHVQSRPPFAEADHFNRLIEALGIQGTLNPDLSYCCSWVIGTISEPRIPRNCTEMQQRSNIGYLEHKHLAPQHCHCVKVPITDVGLVLVRGAWLGGPVRLARRWWPGGPVIRFSGHHSREGFGGMRLSPWRT